MARNTYHQSSQASGLTDHEAISLLREEEQKYNEKFAEFEASYRDAESDAAFREDELDAVLDEKSEIDLVTTTQTYESPVHKFKIYARTNLKSYIDSIRYWWGTLLAFLLIGLGAVVVPAIDAAMFHNLFSQDFENQFGEITNTQAWLVFLFSLQALATFLAAKLFVTTPERRAKLAIVVFVLGIGFAIGASLDHASDKIANHQLSASESGISWDGSAEAQSSEVGISTIISAYLLSLGFIALPLLGALLLSQGWESLLESRIGVKTAKRFRVGYKEWKLAVKKRNSLEAQLIALARNREVIIRGPLDQRINAIIRGQRGYRASADSIRGSGLYGVVSPLDPDNPSARIKDVDGMFQRADNEIAKYGDSYGDQIVTKWQQQKSAQKPPV